MISRYDPAKLRDGYNQVNNEDIFYVSNPALGLWAWKERFAQDSKAHPAVSCRR